MISSTKTTNKKQIFIYSHACERRNLDANKIAIYFIKNNFKIITEDPRGADYIIFFTCAYVNSNIEKCLNFIKKFKNFEGKLIVAGCLPKIAPKKLKNVFRGLTLPTDNLEKIDQIFEDNKIKLKEIEDTPFPWDNYDFFGILKKPIAFFKKIFEKIKFAKRLYSIFQKYIITKFLGGVFPFSRLSDTYDPDKYNLQISRGCIHNCSYCAIKKAIGPLKSKTIEQCINEFKTGLKKGYKNFILQADDVSIYGIDNKSSLPELLEKLTKINGDYNIRLQNIHPMWIIKYADDFERILKKKKIKNILLSVQSGNNRILKSMKRFYSIEDLINVISKLKKADSGLRIGVELLIGFPSETWDEFKDTLDLIKKFHFNGGALFSFSPVDGTEANLLEPKISKREMKKRMKFALKFLKGNNYFAWYSEVFGKAIYFLAK